MKLVAWVWVVVGSLLILMTLTSGFWFATVLMIVSVAAVLPPLWERLSERDPGRKTRVAIAIVSALAGLVAIGSAYSATPEGRVLAEKQRADAEAEKANRAKVEAIAKKAEQDEERAADIRLAAEEKEKKRSGFRCLSSRDGSHREIVNSIKPSLRNPDSFKHIETRITPADTKGNHTLLMDIVRRMALEEWLSESLLPSSTKIAATK